MGADIGIGADAVLGWGENTGLASRHRKLGSQHIEGADDSRIMVMIETRKQSSVSKGSIWEGT